MSENVQALPRGAYWALGLVIVAALLLWAERVVPESRKEQVMEKNAAVKTIAAAVDTLFARHRIERDQVRTWRASAGGSQLERIEQRVLVDRDFLSIPANHELQGLVAPAGAHVVATERTKDNVVTMHIVRDGTTVRSISFVVNTPQ